MVDAITFFEGAMAGLQINFTTIGLAHRLESVGENADLLLSAQQQCFGIVLVLAAEPHVLALCKAHHFDDG